MTTSASDDGQVAEERGEEVALEHEADKDPATSLWRSIVGLVVVGILIGALVFAVPGLDSVADTLKRADMTWIAVAIGLEIVSCLGYVTVFRFVFRRAPLRFAARLAWAELAFGAAVSLGGAGGIALGAWVLRSRGVPSARIAERSAVLFLLTSGVNLVVLIFAATGVAFGVFDAPADALLGWLPLAFGLLILAFFMALPSWARSGASRRGRDTKLGRTLIGTAESIATTRRALVTPSWGLLGAFLYLLADIAVLWACFNALGTPPPFAALVLAYQVGYLANIIPIPGGIIALDAGLVGMLLLYGSSVTLATAAVLVYHAIALWIPLLWGTVSFVLLRRSLDEPLRPRPLPD